MKGLAEKSIAQRLDSIEIMLATLLNNTGIAPGASLSMKEFIATGKAAGKTMDQILTEWNSKQTKEDIS